MRASDLDLHKFSRRDRDLLQSFLTNAGLTLDSLPLRHVIDAIERCMVDHFSGAMSKIQTSASSLDLAITLFQNPDQVDSAPIRGWPYVDCVRVAGFFPTPHYLAGQNAGHFDPCPNFHKHCVFDTISSAVTAQIIAACGLNPATCTHATLEELDPFIVCLSCTTKDSNEFSPTMPWTQGVRRRTQTRMSSAPANLKFILAFPLARGTLFHPCWEERVGSPGPNRC